MISTNPTEDRALKFTAATALTLMVVLTSLRACESMRTAGVVCSAIEAFRLKAVAYFSARNAQ